ncbi:ATP-binding cassette domain-containing protein [Actinomyces sp. 2119]|uniref:ATP-binding cassette domain-containing protein n=1 Tax=Actinomyces sp. 2119 TaxID=2321393 RepID=UPI000E6CDE12|nr:ATP-binding cassette domain-containing protein [Actinomyces sp. 2119]RJF42557.1 ATP-binding cassette domain-containing protein [Actinomyces sp. 2119]
MGVTVRAHRLGAVYGSQQRLFDVSFEVQPHEVVGVLGTNGAGKTTLFHRLLGALPGPGTAWVAGYRGSNRAPSPHRVGAVLDSLTATLICGHATCLHPGVKALVCHKGALTSCWRLSA